MATTAQISAKIQKNVAAKDKYLADFRAKQAMLTAEYDEAVAAEEMAALVANMSDVEKQAIMAELGDN